MSKLRERLSKWFLNTAKKLDENTVNEEIIHPIFSTPAQIISYDQYHIDRLHAQHMISEFQMNMYQKNLNLNFDEMIGRKLSEAITDEIFNNYGCDVKKEQTIDGPDLSTIYSLDVYVCKPQKKETSK